MQTIYAMLRQFSMTLQTGILLTETSDFLKEIFFSNNLIPFLIDMGLPESKTKYMTKLRINKSERVKINLKEFLQEQKLHLK